MSWNPYRCWVAPAASLASDPVSLPPRLGARKPATLPSVAGNGATGRRHQGDFDRRRRGRGLQGGAAVEAIAPDRRHLRAVAACVTARGRICPQAAGRLGLPSAAGRLVCAWGKTGGVDECASRERRSRFSDRQLLVGPKRLRGAVARSVVVLKASNALMGCPRFCLPSGVACRSPSRDQNQVSDTAGHDGERA